MAKSITQLQKEISDIQKEKKEEAKRRELEEKLKQLRKTPSRFSDPRKKIRGILGTRVSSALDRATGLA